MHSGTTSTNQPAGSAHELAGGPFVDTQAAAVGAGAGLPAVHVFQPRETIRYRHSSSAGGNGDPEYPAPAAHIDLRFRDAPAADTRLEIVDAKGQVVRGFGVMKPAPAGGGQEMRGPFRGQGGPSGIRGEAGMQRFSWDMRYPGPWAPNAPNGSGGGPLAPPGKYTVRLTSGGQTQTRTFEIKVDPRVTRDGVTQTDLEEQVAFQLKVRDALSDARRLQQQVEEAMKKAGVAGLPAATPGMRPTDVKFAHPLQTLLARLIDQPGIYPQPMLMNQLQNVQRMVGQADQKVGKDAVDRYNDLMKELEAAKSEFQKVGGTM
jgi:hypothetical protein